jgi:hypothetical protein
MDKVRYSSFKFKVWEDKVFKLEKQMQQALHLDDIKLQKRASSIVSDATPTPAASSKA